jgi:peptidoglycan/LPS O-acetylase OafA/YrhL
MDTPLAPEMGIDSPDLVRQLAIQRLKLRQDFKGIAAGAILAAIVAVVIWAVGEGGYFWPAWVMVLAAIPVAVSAWKAYGPPNRISEDDVQREMARLAA